MNEQGDGVQIGHTGRRASQDQDIEKSGYKPKGIPFDHIVNQKEKEQGISLPSYFFVQSQSALTVELQHRRRDVQIQV